MNRKYSIVYLFIILSCMLHFICLNLNGIEKQLTVEIESVGTIQDNVLIRHDGNSTIDAGNNISAAMLIDFGIYICSLPDGDLDDFYAIYIPVETEITIEIAGQGSTNFDLRLYNPDETLMAASFDDYSIESLTVNIFESGTYYIQVHKTSGSGIYYLSTESDLPETPIVTPTTDPEPNDSTLLNVLIPSIIIFVLAIIIIVGVFQIKKRTRESRKAHFIYTKTEKAKYEEKLEENIKISYSFEMDD